MYVLDKDKYKNFFHTHTNTKRAKYNNITCMISSLVKKFNNCIRVERLGIYIYVTSSRHHLLFFREKFHHRDRIKFMKSRTSSL